MPYEIEVHHINVGQGDATLILLKINQLIEKAVLIDFGPREACSAVLSSLKNHLHPQGKSKTLDAIIITHYDADHVNGFIEILNTLNLLNEFSQFINKTVLYDQGDSGGATQKCPYLNLESLKKLLSEKKIIRLTGGAPSAGNKMLGKELFWVNPQEELKQLPQNQLAVDELGSKKIQPKSDHGCPEINLKNLRCVNQSPIGMPGLFCIAVNQHVLAPESHKLELIKSGDTIPNRRSIGLILVSHNNEILYYLGGDLSDDIEGSANRLNKPPYGIVKWLECQGYSDQSNKSIEGMKLSHHGAINSTPEDLLRCLKPKYIIISAGEDRGYRHPRVEIIIYLAYLNLINKLSSIVLATRYPYYLASLNEVKNYIRKGVKYDSILTLVNAELSGLDPFIRSKVVENLIKPINNFRKLKDDYSKSFYEFIEDIWKKNLQGYPAYDVSLTPPIIKINSNGEKSSSGKKSSSLPIIRNLQTLTKKEQLREKNKYKEQLYDITLYSRKLDKREIKFIANTLESTDQETISLKDFRIIANNQNKYYNLISSCDETSKFLQSFPTIILIEDYNNQNILSKLYIEVDNEIYKFNHEYGIGCWFLDVGFILTAVLNNVIIQDDDENISINSIQWELQDAINQTLKFYGQVKIDEDNDYNYALSFNLNSDIKIKLIDAAKIAGVVSNNDELNFIYQLLDQEPSLNLYLNLSKEKTQVNFYPKDYASIYISIFGKIEELSFKIGEFFTFKQIDVGFETINSPINDNIFSKKSRFYLSTICEMNIRKSKEPISSQVTVSLDSEYNGSFSLNIENFAEIIDELFSNTLGNISLKETINVPYDNLKLADSCGKLNFNSLEIQECIIEFNFSDAPIIKNIIVSSSVNIKENIWANISYETLNKHIVGKIFYKNNGPYKSIINLNKFQNHHENLNLPFGSEKHDINELSFETYMDMNYYRLFLNLTSDQGWEIPHVSWLKLINIQFELNFQNTALSYASLSASLQLGNSLLDVSAIKEDTEWKFKASLADVSVSDLVNLFIDKVLYNPSINCPEFIINDGEISFNLDTSDGTKTFDVNANLLIGGQTFSITTKSFKQKESSKYIYIDAKWEESNDKTIKLSDLLNMGDFIINLPEWVNISLDIKKIEFQFYFNTCEKSDQDEDDIIDRLFIFSIEGTNIQAKLIVFPIDGKYNCIFDGNLNLNIHPLPLNLPLIGAIEFKLPISCINVLVSSQELSQERIKKIQERIKGASEYDFLSDIPDNTNLNNLLNLRIKHELGGKTEWIELEGFIHQSENQDALRNSLSNQESANPISSLVKWIEVNKSIGPISISKLGLGYEKQKINFLLDAAVLLGVLKIGFEELSLSFDINNLTKIPNFHLSGMAIDYSSNPIEIGGSFLEAGIKEVPEGIEKEHFDGSIVIKTGYVDIGAAGFYTKLVLSDNIEFSSVFIFFCSQAKAGFGGPPYFYVTGFAGGFGYNQQLRIPSQDEIFNFPLIVGASDSSKLAANNPNPIDDLPSVLKKLRETTDCNKPWIDYKLGENWLAVGIDFKSFEMIQSKALIIAEFGKEFSCAIIGRSCLQFPVQLNGKVTPPIVYIEMDLEAVLKPSEGLLAIAAIINPNSFIIDRSFHLHGGFAFNLWFTGKHAGDFVVTLGGYGPKFPINKYPHYPQVPRIGIDAHISDQLYFSGNSYFALTPSCVMAGIDCKAIFDAGDLKAWFKAYADFTINWLPFHYGADAAISVGASYNLDCGLFNKTFSVEIGANLNLWGPPLGGKVYIDWSIISFTIGFGANPQPVSTSIGWDEFKQLLPRPKTENRTNSSSLDAVIDFKIQRGLLREEQKGDEVCWVVRPDELYIQTSSCIPLTEINFNGNCILSNINNAIYIKPMKKSIQTSLYNIEITCNGIKVDTNLWTVTPYRSKQPKALWDITLTSSDEDASDSVLIDQVTGLTVYANRNSPSNPIVITEEAFEHNTNSTSLIIDSPESEKIIEVNKEIVASKIDDNSKRSVLFSYLKSNNQLKETATFTVIKEFKKQISNWDTNQLLMR